jgi:hypothetical protein
MTNVVHAIDAKSGKQEREEYRRLILQGEDFKVVIDNEGDIDWHADDDYDWNSIDVKDIAKFNKILNRAAELEVICDSTAELEGYKRMVAEAIARALDRDLSSATEMLDAADRVLREKLRDQTRLRYLLASVCFTIPSVLLLLVWRWRDYWFALLGQSAFWIILASSSGALGALLSVIARSSEPSCSQTAKPYVHVVEAGSRILGGAIAGSLIAVAVKSGWVLEPISNGSRGNATAIIAAFAAGYLERLTPTLVKQFEGGVHMSSDNETRPPPGSKPRGKRTAGGRRRAAQSAS